MINKISKVPVTKLSTEQIQKTLTSLPNWSYENNEISKEYTLGNFEQTWAFLNQISLRSHLWGHHPTILTVSSSFISIFKSLGVLISKKTYNKVKITLSTHDVQGISDIDVKFAKRIEGYKEKFD